jgi:serine/threonine-protein kinase
MMIGQTISHYRILEKIGAGGMGIVYKAEDTKLHRTVALKFLHPELILQEEAKQRFIQEAQAASALDHQNICTIHEIDETKPSQDELGESQIFISMAYYEGETLKEKIQRGPLSVSEVLHYGMQILHGLGKAHQKGMIHRDIKPANIIITENNEVRILDFGLAKLIGQTTITRSDRAPGTLSYMSPEQIEGKEIDSRTDIWSLGVMLFEMATGELPFQGDYEQAIFYSIFNEHPKPVNEINKKIPVRLARIIQRCLTKNLSKRYQSTIEIYTDFEQLKREIETARTIPLISRKPDTRRVYELPKYIFAAIFLILILSISILYFNNTMGLFTSSGIPAKKNIAILPCNNIGNNPEYYVFLEGLIETLTSKITQLEEMQGNINVVPYSEIRSQEISSIEDAKQRFNINLAVTSSFQPLDENFRLILNLIDTRRIKQLKSAIIEEELSNVIIIQDSALLGLTNMLEVPVEPKKKKLLHAGNTQSSTAFNFYLRGRGLLQDYHSEEQIDSAIRLLKMAVDEDETYPLAYASIGEAYWRKYRLTKEVKWIERATGKCDSALMLNDQIPTVLVTAGLIYGEKGQYKQSLEFFQKALQIDPMNASGLQGLAKTYESMGEYQNAEQSFKNAILVRPNYWGNFNALGVFYFRQGRYEEAVTQFQEVVRLSPQNIKGYSNLGGIYFYLEQLEEAQHVFEKSLNIKPSYNTYYNLATLYFYDNRYNESAKMYENALKLSDKDYRVWGGLAESYYWAGAHEKSPEIYRKAINIAEEKLRVNPRDEETLSYLAGYYLKLNHQDKARNYLQKVIENGPDDINVVFRIAENFELLEERESALLWLEKALSMGYSLASIRSHPALRDIKSDVRFTDLIKKYDVERSGSLK